MEQCNFRAMIPDLHGFPAMASYVVETVVVNRWIDDVVVKGVFPNSKSVNSLYISLPSSSE
jgi:hypothetical protein